MKIRKRCFLILILSVLLILTGCNKDSENLEVEKGLSEVRFLENQCITILGKYISDDYLINDNQIDWEQLKEDYIVLDNSIDVILIDMASLQVPSKNIVELENNCNDLDNFMQSKDIDAFMKKICDNYSLVSNSILDSISKDSSIKQEKKVKSYLLYVGYYLTSINKEEALKSINNFQDSYSDLSKNQDYLDDNSYKVNRIFINIQKLKTLIANDNLENGKETFSEILDYF